MRTYRKKNLEHNDTGFSKKKPFLKIKNANLLSEDKEGEIMKNIDS